MQRNVPLSPPILPVPIHKKALPVSRERPFCFSIAKYLLKHGKKTVFRM